MWSHDGFLFLKRGQASEAGNASNAAKFTHEHMRDQTWTSDHQFLTHVQGTKRNRTSVETYPGNKMHVLVGTIRVKKWARPFGAVIVLERDMPGRYISVLER